MRRKSQVVETEEVLSDEKVLRGEPFSPDPIYPTVAVLAERVSRLEEELVSRQELAEHEADRKTELLAIVDKHIHQWARGRDALEAQNVRAMLMELIEKL